MKVTEDKIGAVAYAYIGGLLDLWKDTVLSDVKEVAEGAENDLPELAGKRDLIEQSIRAAAEDVYEHANAYALMRFSRGIAGDSLTVQDVLNNPLN